MKMRKMLVMGVLAGALSIFAACGGGDDEQTLLVGAAMSLHDVNQEIQRAFNAAHDNITVEFTHASSGDLQTQIEEGADIDVFMSAAMAQMRNLEEQGLIYGSSRNLVRNTVALVVPVGSNLGLTSFADLANANVINVGVGDEAMPIGNFAREVFDSYGILDIVNDKTVFATDVAQIMMWVETGEVDAGIVFGTNAIASEGVELIVIADANRHAPSLNPVGIVADSGNISAAQTFVDFLFSNEAREIFESFGFAMYN